MRRLPILLVFVLMFALLALVPASADKPDCKNDPSHPSCNEPPAEEPPHGASMCDPADYPFYLPDGQDDLVQIDGVQYDDFTFQLSGNQAYACIDVISTRKGPWTVTIAGSGARSLALIPRDSVAPGDSCGGWLLRRAANIYGELILGYGGSIPVATINACGTDFGEWVDIDLDGLDPRLVLPDGTGGDCDVIDGDRCFVAKQLDVEHPLVLQAVFGGSRDGTTTFDVDLP